MSNFCRIDRSDFKNEPCKIYSLDGWTAEPMSNPQQKNTFQLINMSLRTAYKVRTGSPKSTKLWLEVLQQHSKIQIEKPISKNLMTFE